MYEIDRQSGSLSQFFSKKWQQVAFSSLALAIITAGLIVVLAPHQTTHAASPGDWSGYMLDNGHSGFNGVETVINPTSAPLLKMHWTFQGAGATFSQPIVSNGMVYWGSSDGYERATDLNGALIWQQNLGQTTSICNTNTVTRGVISTATVASVLINGTPTSVLFVGGGDDHLYALDPSTGAILWSTLLGVPSSNTFIWDSPNVYNNSVYIGTASLTDCNLILSQLFRLDATTGTIQNTFNVVSTGCRGAGIWGSPTIDPSDNSVYFTTGNSPNKCTPTAANAFALVKLSATDLSFISSWQVPMAERTKDGDFGSTPTLFQATIGGTPYQLVGAVNKNGTFYAFDRTNVSNGPIWRAQIAVGGQCPECGQGSISSAAWDGTTLYVAGGNTVINGVSCKGSLRALNPIDGTFLWQRCLLKVVLGAVTVVPGVVALIETSRLDLLDVTSGTTFFTSTIARFYGSPSISNGVLYAGDRDGHLYAFGT